MKVKELMKVLEQYDPEMRIVTEFGGDGDGYCGLHAEHFRTVEVLLYAQVGYGGAHLDKEDVQRRYEWLKEHDKDSLLFRRTKKALEQATETVLVLR